MASGILFLKAGSFSNINREVYNVLKNEFPDSEIEILDVNKILKSSTAFLWYFVNIYFFIAEYGYDIIAGNKKKRDWIQWFFATSYISLRLGNRIRKLCRGKEYKFTFQTQSLFNGKLKNIPHFVYTDHSTKANTLYPGINPKQYIRSGRFIKKSEEKIYREASLIFTFGSLVASSLRNQYHIPSEKIVTVYAGCNTLRSREVNPQKYFYKNILFVGTEWERKGGPVLLKAFERVLAKHPDATLTVVGCQPAILSPNCTVVGEVNVEEVATYYEKASVFCMPTTREPFGIVFVEAMSFALPVVANKIGSISDMVKDGINGYLVENDSLQYSEVLGELIAHPQKCKEMGENGFKFAESEFNWKRVGEKIRKNIDAVLYNYDGRQ